MKIFRREEGTNDPFNGIDLGDSARDNITGFLGVIVGTNRNISGCDQVCIQPQMTDGKFEEARWIDIERVQLVQKGVVEMTSRRTGADVCPPDRYSKR